MDVLIAGGGIGGLAAALFLNAKGITTTVYEATNDIKELGVGINIQPQAVEELSRIGLAEDLAGIGNSCIEWAMFNRFGQTIWREPRGLAAGHSRPQISVHRGKLQGLLLKAAQHRLGPDRILTGHRLTAYDQTDTNVTAHFANGATATGDILIAADGIHSTIRRTLYAHEGNPIFAGTLLWRGMTEMKPTFNGGTMIFAGYRDQKFIAYPITGADEHGNCMVNWIADISADQMVNREDWNRPGRLEDFLPNYETWTFPWLDVPACIRRADAVYEYPMVDRDPLPRWTHGRVTLLGDAAHPMYPVGANGASQAIRDGSALADSLAAGDIHVGLLAYEQSRRPATSEIVLSNRQLGPEQVMQWAHERAPDGFDNIEDVIPKADLEAVSQRYRQITRAASFSKDTAPCPTP